MVHLAPLQLNFHLEQTKVRFLSTPYYPFSKKLNHKDRVNIIVALPGESVSSFWNRFTSFLKSVPNHRIDDESLKEYFYW